jgi:hypothetical protein
VSREEQELGVLWRVLRIISEPKGEELKRLETNVQCGAS